MKRTTFERLWICSLMILFSLAAALGCQAKHTSYRGTIATQENNVPLHENGPHQGRWEDSNIIVNYTFNHQPGGFEFSGDIELAPRLTKSFLTVNNFSVNANFIDDEKKILNSITLVITGPQAIRQWRFAHTLDLPPEARAINFSYSGRAAEGGTQGRGGDGIDTFFWRVP